MLSGNAGSISAENCPRRSADFPAGLLNAAKEVREHGPFGYIDTSIAAPDMNAFLRE